MHAQTLTPQLRAAVRAAYADPKHKLVRCREGYAAGDTTVTRRVVNMLDRAYVITYQGNMQAEAVLTEKGLRLGSELAKTAPPVPSKCTHRGCHITDGKPCAYAQCPNRKAEPEGAH